MKPCLHGQGDVALPAGDRCFGPWTYGPLYLHVQERGASKIDNALDGGGQLFDILDLLSVSPKTSDYLVVPRRQQVGGDRLTVHPQLYLAIDSPRPNRFP